MIRLVDNLLRRVLLDQVAGLREVRRGRPAAPPSESQVRFEPPDERWRTYVRNQQRNALNVYLVDLRENRKLRSNDRVERPENGLIVSEPAPARLDCHYLISAYSPYDDITEQIQPALDEHDLLYQVSAALMRSGPLNPSRIYAANPAAPNNWPARYWEHDLPLAVAPVEGFGKLAEFWGTMGQRHRWKPVLYVIVTVPVDLVTEVSGQPVVALITEHRLMGSAAPAGEVWIQIGGRVLRRQQPNNRLVPVQDAWVRLATVAGQPLRTTQSDAEGQFIFGGLTQGFYQLQARAVGLGPFGPLTIEVPPTQPDAYDLIFP